MPDNPEIIHQGDWFTGFNCEAREWLGRDRSGYYYALEISPQQDEQDLHWHGPFESQQKAAGGLQSAFNAWQKDDDGDWQEWEDDQIEAVETKRPIGPVLVNRRNLLDQARGP